MFCCWIENLFHSETCQASYDAHFFKVQNMRILMGDFIYTIFYSGASNTIVHYLTTDPLCA